MTLEIMTANRLRDGTVVWFGPHNQWVETVADAVVFDERTAEAGLEAARVGEHNQMVVGVYPVEAILENGKPTPTNNREQIRAYGPTVAYNSRKPVFSVIAARASARRHIG